MLISPFEVLANFVSAASYHRCAAFGGLPALIDPPGASSTWRAKISTNGAADDSNDPVIYNPTTGGFFYDVDGSGSGAAIQIALLGTGLHLSSRDFFVQG